MREALGSCEGAVREALGSCEGSIRIEPHLHKLLAVRVGSCHRML